MSFPTLIQFIVACLKVASCKTYKDNKVVPLWFSRSLPPRRAELVVSTS